MMKMAVYAKTLNQKWLSNCKGVADARLTASNSKLMRSTLMIKITNKPTISHLAFLFHEAWFARMNAVQNDITPYPMQS